MGQKETVVVFVHGANQADKSEEKNRQVWEEAFNVENTPKKHFLPIIDGQRNRDIKTYHESKHQNSDYPAFSSKAYVWYGGIWKRVSQIAKDDRFSDRLNPSKDEDQDDRMDLIERVERGVIRKHFDEIVPFYELAVLSDTGKTLYEDICDKMLDDLISATNNGELHYVLIAHSMGCAVCYNVMTHISCEKAGVKYVPFEGGLSDAYRQKVAAFAAKSNCFGLMTFGNYTAYNWAQRMNHRSLFGKDGRYFVYPDAVGRWWNFWTVLGGDPYIIDDVLENSMVDDDEDRFDDVSVIRPPFLGIGHGRSKWFKRDQFVKRLAKRLEKHLYV